MLNLLVRIAQEKVGYDFNYPGAIKFLQEAIPDIPIELCNGLILGTHSITNINGFDFDIEDIPNENTLNIIELIRVKHDSIEESYTGDTPINYTVERIRDNFNKLWIDLPLEKYKALKRGETDWLEDDFDTVWQYETINKGFERDIETLNNMLVVVQILFPTSFIKEDILELLDWIQDLYIRLNNEKPKEFAMDALLDKYVKNSIRLDKIDSIEPTDEICDAGWISPDGDYYGLDGEVGNQLHIRISDLLIEQRVIPKHPELKPDRWMEENGWLKQHHNKLLYSGYFYEIPVTKEQMLTAKNILLQKYTQAELQDKLIPVNKLLEIDNIQLRKHFS